MSNGRPFRPTNHRNAGHAKANAFRGPMGQARLATMEAPGRHKDPKAGGHTPVLTKTEAERRARSPWRLRLIASARLPRAQRRPIGTV